MEKINNFEEFDAKVDKYLRHQMTAEEEQAFKLEIAQEPEKKERARITALMIKTMRQEGLKHDHNIIKNIHKMNETQFKKAIGFKSHVLKLWPRIIKYSVAACFVGILSFGAYNYYEYNQTVSLGNSQYFAYIPDLQIDGKNNIRGNIDEKVFEKLMNLFENVKKGIDIKSTIDELESLYEQSFRLNSSYHEYQDDISWNLAIAYLKNGEREKPLVILEDMVKRNINYPEITHPIQKLIDQIKAL